MHFKRSVQRYGRTPLPANLLRPERPQPACPSTFRKALRSICDPLREALRLWPPTPGSRYNEVPYTPGHRLLGSGGPRARSGQAEPGGHRHARSHDEAGVGGLSNRLNAEPNAHVPAEAINELVGREIEPQRREGATVFDVLRTLGWDEQALRRLDEEIPEGGWLEGSFSVMMKQRRRKKPISRATINEALRNIDPADIGLDGNGKERGGIVKVSMQRSVKMIGSLKDPEDAIEQIVHALREWALKGRIECAFD